MIIKIDELTALQTQYYLHHLVAPRPIALSSTIDAEGNVNLSPFSFFNVFSVDPPIVIFSVVRRLRNNTDKHTLENLQQVPEVAISIVTYNIAHQVNISGHEYPKSTNEFIKAGFTEKIATMIRPPIVAEAKASLECKVKAIHSLGTKGGAGQLVIAQVLCIHIDNELIDEENKILHEKLDLVARLGSDKYARISAENMFSMENPHKSTGIGLDMLPQNIRCSSILTGNHLAQLANVSVLPQADENFKDERLEALQHYLKGNKIADRIHTYAKELIDEGKILQAWQVLLDDK